LNLIAGCHGSKGQVTATYVNVIKHYLVEGYSLLK